MKLTKLLLTTTTALGLSMTAAIADDNNTYLDQVQSGGGTGTNSALVTQSGTGNDAGSETEEMKQTATANSSNDLDILQSGNDNEIGLNGFSQLSQYNSSPDGNTATITQSSNSNVVAKVTQKNRFGGAVGATANSLIILQETGNDNVITEVFQDKHKGKSGNMAGITMSGTANTISSVVQAVTGGEDGNAMDVTISGDNNGRGTLSGLAAASGATTSELKQGFEDVNNGNAAKGDNNLTLIVSGNTNQFGVTQQGTSNDVGTLVIAGDSNEVGVSQDGDGNMLTLASIAVGSDGNVIGVTQMGVSNTASASVDGDNNQFGIMQNGNFNDASVDIIGNDNGVSSGGLFGDALITDATNGLIAQWGNDNTASLTVNGDNNAFSYMQGSSSSIGNSNSITGTVNGSGNAVAVAQLGSNNTAGFSQSGTGNNAGIIQ